MVSYLRVFLSWVGFGLCDGDVLVAGLLGCISLWFDFLIGVLFVVGFEGCLACYFGVVFVA